MGLVLKEGMPSGLPGEGVDRAAGSDKATSWELSVCFYGDASISPCKTATWLQWRNLDLCFNAQKIQLQK